MMLLHTAMSVIGAEVALLEEASSSNGGGEAAQLPASHQDEPRQQVALSDVMRVCRDCGRRTWSADSAERYRRERVGMCSACGGNGGAIMN